MIILSQFIHVPRLRKQAAPMPIDYEFVDSYYLEAEDFATSESDARDFVRLECLHGRFQE